MTLQMLRDAINVVDHDILSLLAQRKELVAKVGEHKKTQHLPPLDPSRWQQVLDSRTQWAVELGLNPEFVVDLFNRIHEYALQIEGEICHK